MTKIPDKSVDMIFCDLPYGTTACKWDSVIPFEPLWSEYKRIIKDNCAIVLFASQPFTTTLINSNEKWFKYCWVWNKQKAGNFAVAKYQPLRYTEDIVIFYNKKSKYFPQMIEAEEQNKRPRNKAYKKNNELLSGFKNGIYKCSDNHNENLRYPSNIISIKSTEGECNNLNRIHPTQKPVALCEYLINTYTQENELVLDNCIGSGTTAIACINTNRNYIGFEKDKNIYDKCQERIELHIKNTQEIA